ncbi:MAG: DNA topoisomerase [Lachnospiraceae bacterium]|nr:DNA topoisomerase [Lachnospiraceae bacterium]
MKSLFIAEKPSVAREFANALKEKMSSKDGYLESDSHVVTWCVGHLVTMSYPDAYDEKYKKWSFDTLPFLPETFKYEIIGAVKKQFGIVRGLLTRPDVETIYVCTDSGREGEYIYRLVAMMAGVDGKVQKRVWIDSQTEEEINRGIKEAKDISEYDNLAASAYLRAKEDYLMGINFSRALSLRYGFTVSDFLGTKYQAISVGRVMTCVLGMVVRREREIRNFVKTVFYRVMAKNAIGGRDFMSEWRCTDKSRYTGSPVLYKENGFLKKEEAERFISELISEQPQEMLVKEVKKKKETKNPPLLFNLAELQNECSKRFKISPDRTLSVVQELYEKKLVTYPRTDARVLSSAAAKEIYKNLKGLTGFEPLKGYAAEILGSGSYKNIAKTKYTNDKQITDHYAIIPTGQGLNALRSVSELSANIYELIARRFLSVFYPAAVYNRLSLELIKENESFFSNFKILKEEGYLKVTGAVRSDKDDDINDAELLNAVSGLKKGDRLPVEGYELKEGETSPPKRYTSGSMILAMENAGQLIEDETLREQIKGSGIGTSATRAEILKKLVNISYLDLNKKTQIITPTHLGEMIFDVVNLSIRSLLNPELTASWEKGLTYVAEGTVTSDEYMDKLEAFITRNTETVKASNNQNTLKRCFNASQQFYKKTSSSAGKKKQEKK